jgi:2-methylcitrate dehydratase PrpD
MSEATGLTRTVASFIADARPSDLSDNLVALGKKSILDSIGLAFAGSGADSGKLVRHYLDAQHLAEGPATIIGARRKLAPRFAAFANGIAIHADDYDDTQLAVAPDRVYGLLTHPSAPVFPAALGVAEKLDSSGAETMLAYHIGIEVACKIAEAIHPRHYQSGVHSTGTCGAFGAAAAAAKLIGLERDEVARALAIAGSEAAGLRENFGTMTKPFHAGRASESGVVAAELAALEWTATDCILEAPRGFFSAAGGGYDAAAIEGKLGRPWTFLDPGISIKPHPSGSLTHPGSAVMLDLIARHGIRAEDVAHVGVGTNSNMPNALIHHRPKDALQAKFSMEFCMALLLLDGRADLDQFTDAAVARADIQAMIEKIEFTVNDEAEKAGFNKMTTIVTVTLKDGRRFSGRADFGKGSPANPMGFDGVAEKFRSCLEFAHVGHTRADAIVSLVRDLETLPSIRRLTALLS